MVLLKKVFLILVILICFGCGKENDIVKFDSLKDTVWIADGTQIVSYPIPEDYDSKPYYLSFKKNNKVELIMNNKTYYGTYQLTNEDLFINIENEPINLCNYTKEEITCNLYASRFIKYEG